MKQNIRIYEFLTIAVMGLFIYYTYQSIIALGYVGGTGSFAGYVALAAVLISLLTMFISKNKAKTNFTRFWWAWIFWLLIDFFILGLRGEGLANIWFVTFAPMTFFFFYNASSHSDNIRRIATLGFLAIFIIAFIMNLSFLSYAQVNYNEEIGITNLVYWCLCAVPFIFLLKKKWLLFAFLVLTTIIILLTGKRSATVCLVLTFVSILWYSWSKGSKVQNILFIFVGGIVLYFIIQHYFSYAVEGIIGRMNDIEASQGSSRIPLYQDVFKVIETNSLLDWLVGRGYGSIIITKHTNAHNDALQMLFEYGIVGLVFYLLMLWNAIKSSRALYRHNSPYFMGYLVSLIIFVVLGMVSNLVVFNSYFAFICAYWGIAEYEISQYKYPKGRVWNI